MHLVGSTLPFSDTSDIIFLWHDVSGLTTFTSVKDHSFSATMGAIQSLWEAVPLGSGGFVPSWIGL